MEPYEDPYLMLFYDLMWIYVFKFIMITDCVFFHQFRRVLPENLHRVTWTQALTELVSYIFDNFAVLMMQWKKHIE